MRLAAGLTSLVLGGASLAVATAPPAYAAPPENDELSAAAPMPVGATVDATTAEATLAPGEPENSCAPLGQSVWYSFSVGAAAAGYTMVSTLSESTARDTVLAVYTSSSDPATYGSLEEVGCNDDDENVPGTRLSSVGLFTSPGTTYYVQLGDYDGGAAPTNSGPVQLRVGGFPPSPPENDVLSDAAVVSSSDTTLSVDTTVATVDLDEDTLQPGCFDAATIQNSAWYVVSPAGDDPVEVAARSAGGVADPVVAVYRLADEVNHHTTQPEDLSPAVACATDVSADDSDAVVEFDGEASAAYLVQVGDLGFGSGPMEVDVDFVEPSRPANDDLARAARVRPGELIHGTTAGASTQPSEPSQPPYCAQPVNSVWYRLTVAAEQDVTIDFYNERQESWRHVSVWTGPATDPTFADLTRTDCASDFYGYGGHDRAQVQLTATAPTTYWIQVADFGSWNGTGPGSFRMLVDVTPALEPPANDEIANAAPLALPAPGAPTTVAVDNTAATTDAQVFDRTSCDQAVPQRGVWFEVTPATDRLLTLRTTGNRDTKVEVWRGPADADYASLINIGCFDDDVDRNAVGDFRARAGGHYYLSVGTYNGRRNARGAGAFQLQLEDFEPTVSTTALTAETTGADGRDVRLTAVVGPAAQAAGTVTFTEGSTVLAEDVPLGGPASDRATFLVPDAALGGHDYTATFVPDSWRVEGSSAQDHVVVTAPSTTELEATGAGRTVTLTASVTPAAATPALAGTVEFLDGTAAVGSAPVAAGGASLVLPTATVGEHGYRARFVPAADNGYAGSTSPVATLAVSAAPSVTVSGAPTGVPPGPGGRDVALAAQVAGIAGDPVATGRVEWFEGSTSLGSVELTGGQAALVTPNVSLGEHRYRAVFTPAGGSPFLGATSADTVVAVAAVPTAAAASTARLDAPNRVRRGARPRVTATVLSGGVGAAGPVTVAVNGRAVATVPLVDGRAVVRLPRIRRVAVVTLVFPGSATAAPATDLQRIRLLRPDRTPRSEGEDAR